MMNKILNDLKRNIGEMYHNANVITVNKYIHHSLKYGEVKKIFTHYKADTAQLEVALHNFITAHESKQKVNRQARVRKRISKYYL